ncbi:MAG: serine/threonine-protein kinase [Deltaproteobacteria bacterium]|nr:serine/threonine-protein kinase [Deltaproteobacteria bacterium]
MSVNRTEIHERRLTRGTILWSKYEVGPQIGQGAMGSVYQGRDVRTGMPVAIKVEHLDPGQVYVGRVAREAALLGRISHENIARMVDFGRLEDGGAVLVNEFVDGISLDKLLVKLGGSLPWPQALGLMVAVLDALGAAHDMAVLHRDVKPQNILVTSDLPPKVKLIDFGIARSLGNDLSLPPLTGMGEVLGTVRYMAPEQLKGDTLDHQTDLYAASLVLAEMLSGRVPYGESFTRGMLAKSEGQPHAPLVVPDDREPWPDALQAIIESGLSFDASRRPPTAASYAQALRGILANNASLPPVMHTEGPDLRLLARTTAKVVSADTTSRAVAVWLVVVRLNAGILRDERERQWMADSLAEFARPVELGRDLAGFLLRDSGSGASSNLVEAIVSLLRARYGEVPTARERVWLQDGLIHVGSLVSAVESISGSLAK